MYLLDTDHLSILERGGEIAQRIIMRLTILSPEDIYVTVVTYEEQTRGWLGYIAKARNLEEQIIAYHKLEKHIATFSKLKVIGFDGESLLNPTYGTVFYFYRSLFCCNYTPPKSDRSEKRSSVIHTPKTIALTAQISRSR